MPKVSVIIPAHNRPDLLAAAVASCLVQTLTDIEVLVVDDGSEKPVQPCVEAALREFANRSVVRYFRQARAGAPSARNHGLENATGQFVQFLDSDDLLHPEKLRKQAELLEKNTGVEMVSCLEEWFSETIGDTKLLWNEPDNQAALDRFPRNDVVWSTISPLWRRAALDRIGPWNTSLACWQDWEFHIRALALGLRHAHLPEVLNFIRDHRGPRISQSLDAIVREKSKIEACRLAAAHLRAGGVMQRDRGNGLAVFLLGIARDLAALKDARTTRAALQTAIQCAGSVSLKLRATTMLMASKVAEVRGKNQTSALHRAEMLINRFVKAPETTSHWKTIPSARQETPAALLEALARLNAPEPDNHPDSLRASPSIQPYS